MKKSYVLVGTGGRCVMFLDPLASKYRENTELKALCDPSRTRMEYHRERLQKEFDYPEVALYSADQFDQMLAETRPDAVIVCSIDSTHHDYIIRAVEHGCDVICEKPITIDADKCRAIHEAVKRTGRKVRVTFNNRWGPPHTKIYQMLREGVIGEVRHVNMEYLLDTSHGADYFRRWHSNLANSGGLLVHKSTHHFDLINWLIDGIPTRVFASGRLAYYGKKNALARGDEALTRYDRYTGQETGEDPFRLDLTSDERLQRLYLDAEKETGYQRDRNVFRDDIDIYDAMSVVVDYRSGASLSYSLVAFSPYEGFRVSFTGDRGRLEYSAFTGSHIIKGQSDDELEEDQKRLTTKRKELRVYPLFGDAYDVEVPEGKGGHGGGDPLIVEAIFAENPPSDPFRRSAGHEQGIASVMIGAAANESIATGQPVQIDSHIELVPGKTSFRELT